MRFSSAAIVLASSQVVSGFNAPAFSRTVVSTFDFSTDATFHQSSCACSSCASSVRISTTRLRMSDEEVPVVVEAMDGVDSEEEMHNTERPARKSGTAKHKKGGRPGKPISELEVGSTVTATVKTTTSYGAFLDIYLDYAFKSMHGDSITDKIQKFALMFELAEMQLSGFAEEYMLGRLLARTIKPTNIPFIMAYYQKFEKISVVNSYRKAVQDVYERAVAFSDKQAAPEFVLQNPEGDMISLVDLQGKLVYVSFWASWCQPCLKEQEASLSNRIALQDKDIVFLYISVDDKEEDWKRFLERKPNYGINVWAKGRGNEVTRSYNVISLPHYFLLDKQGRFITDFKKASDPDFIFNIRRLLEQ